MFLASLPLRFGGRRALQTCFSRPVRTDPETTLTTLNDSQASFSPLKLPFDVNEEVLQALSESRPVVALETAIVTHGLPTPHAHQVPLALEDIIRQQGATPATIGIIGGRLKVGLTGSEIERLAAPSKEKWKVGRRELAGAVVKKVDGGTTVSGTMVMAHLAGIKVICRLFAFGAVLNSA